MSRSAGIPGLACALALCGSGAASAQVLPAKDMVDQAQTLTPADPQGTEAMKSGSDIVVAPIPVSNPAFGTGLAAAGVLFYNPNQSKDPWISGVGGGYTSSKTWGVGAFHRMQLGHDRYRVMAFAGYGDAHLDFYGIGPEAGAAGVSVEMNDKAFVGLADAQYQPFTKGFLRHVYVGLRVFYLGMDSRLTVPPPPNRPDLDPPDLERKSTLGMAGGSFTFDSLDNSLQPHKGVNFTMTFLQGQKWMGSDFRHTKLQMAGNAFFSLGKGTVLGIRKQLCGVSDDAPYYDLCMFGQQGDLRGYESGRYRDGASWALQGELRQHMAGRWGMVAFYGVGGIAEDTKAIWKHSSVMTSGGAGVRYLASRSANVNLRADIAWGKDGPAFYFGIGEAF